MSVDDILELTADVTPDAWCTHNRLTIPGHIYRYCFQRMSYTRTLFTFFADGDAPDGPHPASPCRPPPSLAKRHVRRPKSALPSNGGDGNIGDPVEPPSKGGGRKSPSDGGTEAWKESHDGRGTEQKKVERAAQQYVVWRLGHPGITLAGFPLIHVGMRMPWIPAGNLTSLCLLMCLCVLLRDHQSSRVCGVHAGAPQDACYGNNNRSMIFLRLHT